MFDNRLDSVYSQKLDLSDIIITSARLGEEAFLKK